MEYATSFTKLSAACHYSRSTLHGMLNKGQIPQRGPQGWRVADVLAAIERNVDPGRRKPAPAAPRSAERSAPNAERIEQSGEPPAPEDYRNRAGLPDDFARGVLFATHLLAYSMPTNVASEVMEHGLDAEWARDAYQRAKADASLVVADPLIAIGLVPEDSLDCGPHAPTLFCGFNPDAFPGAAP